MANPILRAASLAAMPLATLVFDAVPIPLSEPLTFTYVVSNCHDHRRMGALTNTSNSPLHLVRKPRALLGPFNFYQVLLTVLIEQWQKLLPSLWRIRSWSRWRGQARRCVLRLWREIQGVLKWCAGCGVGLNEAGYPGGDRWKPFSAVDCA